MIWMFLLLIADCLVLVLFNFAIDAVCLLPLVLFAWFDVGVFR